MRYSLACLFILLSPAWSLSQPKIPLSYYRADTLYKQDKNAEAYGLFSQLIKTVADDSLHIEIEVRMGYILSAENKIDSAIYYFEVAIGDCINKRIYFRLARTYNGLGNQFLIKKNYNEAHAYYLEGLKRSNSAGDSVRAYLNILISCLKQKKYDTAFALVKNDLGRYKKNTVPYQQFYTDQAKGNFYLSKNRFDSALVFFINAAGETEDRRLKANVFNDLAETYTRLKKIPEAFAYQDSAYAMNNNEKYGENFLPYFDTYEKLFRETGNFQKALAYADSGRYLSDSLFDADKNKATIEADAKYNNQKILADKAVAEKESSINQRNLVITLFGLGFVALLAFVSLRVSRARKKSNTILTLQKKQVQQLADELSVANETKTRLFSTIGHDLRSPVSSLYALLKMEELKGQSQNNAMSGHTVQLLDTLEELLVWSKSQMDGFVLQPVKINIAQLFEELKQFYTPLAQVKDISIVNEASDLTAKTDENILKAILRNIISNAVSHTAPNNAVKLCAESLPGNKVHISVKNPCSEELFKNFKLNFEGSEIKSNAHGFGVVIIKEFALKINAETLLSYEEHHAVLSILL